MTTMDLHSIIERLTRERDAARAAIQPGSAWNAFHLASRSARTEISQYPYKKRARHFGISKVPGKYLATTYSHRTYRPTTIGAVAFHFRVRNGTGWFHHALVTRGQFSLF